MQLVRAAGPASGLYGAKITGGGSGGTVCVLGADTAQAQQSFEALLATYAKRSGHTPYVVSGSSAGALKFGHLTGHFLLRDQPRTDEGAARDSKKRSRP